MNPIPQPIRVILADDHTLVRAGIRALLERLPGVAVVGEAGNGRDVLALVQQHRPDVVLMDVSMPGLNGLDAADRLAKERKSGSSCCRCTRTRNTTGAP